MRGRSGWQRMGPSHTGTPLADLDYVLWGAVLMDSSSQILATTCSACLLWLDHFLTLRMGNIVITGPSKGKFKARAREREKTCVTLS